MFWSVLHGGSYKEQTKNFILSDHFPIFIAVCLFFSSLLDSDMTSYILRTDPALFHSNEAGLLAKHFMDTQYWWISTLVYALVTTIIYLLVCFTNLNHNLFKYMKGTKDEQIWFILRIRIACFFASTFPFFAVLSWSRHL